MKPYHVRLWVTFQIQIQITTLLKYESFNCENKENRNSEFSHTGGGQNMLASHCNVHPPHSTRFQEVSMITSCATEDPPHSARGTGYTKRTEGRLRRLLLSCRDKHRNIMKSQRNKKAALSGSRERLWDKVKKQGPQGLIVYKDSN